MHSLHMEWGKNYGLCIWIDWIDNFYWNFYSNCFINNCQQKRSLISPGADHIATFDGNIWLNTSTNGLRKTYLST